MSGPMLEFSGPTNMVSMWWLLLIVVTHLLSVVVGAVLFAAISTGRLLPRRGVSSQQVKAPLSPTATQMRMDSLAQAALVSPTFDRTEYVGDVRQIPLVSTHKVELGPGPSIPNGFQGKVIRPNDKLR